uniref:General transcription factor 3C polypeptide 5-like n=1 Tax=Phallusia mammillata TaxID=59560 RepID=A0A6F9DES9_9ASCI|nr:general transcription factor 3C polypeptide 5-like [Phallusia mammillata]
MNDNINSNVPCDEARKFISIEYPGIVQNESKMLETMGGLSHIQKVHNDPTKRLDLHFRPTDPSCKPLCADRVPGTSLLLRICKYKRRKKDKSEEIKYEQSICGNVDVVYKFTSMCDYQFLSTTKNEETGEFLNLTPYLKVQGLLKEGSSLKRDAPLFIPPPIFTRLDNPQEYLYKNSVKPCKGVAKHPSSKIGVARPHRFHNAILVKYEDKIPDKPLTTAVENFQATCGHLQSVKQEIVKLFEEQPIWSKNAIQYKVQLRKDVLKPMLPLVAYYSLTGPWRSLWIRFGYDPKLIPESKKFQLIDFRLRRGTHTADIPIRAKRSTFSYKLPNLQPKNKSSTITKESVLATLRADNSNTDPEKDDHQESSTSAEAIQVNKVSESIYVYRPGRLPPNRQMFYMACFVLLPEAQALINQPNNQTVCTKEDGWLLPKTTAKVRDIITKDVYKTISESKRKTSKPDDDYHRVWKKKSAALSLASKEGRQSQGSETDDMPEDISDEETSLEEHSTQDEDIGDEEDFVGGDDDDEKDDSPDEGGWFLDDDEELIDGSLLEETTSVFSDISSFIDQT